MQNFTTLEILLQEVFNGEAAERRCNAKAVEDYILYFAEQIKAKRAVIKAPPPQDNIPTLTMAGNSVMVSLFRGGSELSRVFPLKSFYIYKTNETETDFVTPRPGKDGYTWFMRNYSLAANGDLETFSEVLEPYEGPILYELLKELKN